MTYSLDVRAFTDSISENPELKFETDATGKLIIMSRSTYVQIVVRRLAKLCAEAKVEEGILVCWLRFGTGIISLS
mgnify:CR=1 FL=1